ncbi:MAG TPA: ABC transporter ATP-binding protein [Candidatus Omnitrophota bacterium]|nr:ABC transporter ATP-binding protein [Candidatus Omnitrophota bacterium]HPT06625.1 ABC transporter ATP-binding protein [Candidatus Omnitrophota bacterium]
MKNILFALRGVTYSYLGKIPALNNIDLAVESGSKIAIIGANGSGKSTLLHLLDGLIFPDAGSIMFRGRELSEKVLFDEAVSREFRSSVGFVFQNPEVQLFCPTVREDILFGPLQLGMAKQGIKGRLEKLVELLDLTHLLERSPHQLSVGEKRKVAIASSLILNPAVLLLDEPTAGLDPLTTRKIIDLLIDEHACGKTIITSTHDLHIVEEIADFVHVFSSNKQIVASGSVDTILANVELLQAHNLVHIHRHKHEDTEHSHPHQHIEHHHHA